MNELLQSGEEGFRESGASSYASERGRRRVELARGEKGWTVRIGGALDAAAAQELHGLLPEAAPGSRLLLDCRRVEYATAAGLRAVVEFAAQLRSRSVSLALSAPPGALRDLVRLTGIDRLPGVVSLENEPEPRAD